MKVRKPFLVAGLVLLVLCTIGLVLAFKYVYWPRVTQASTVAAAEAGDLQLLGTLQQKGMTLNFQDPRKFMWTPLIAAVHAGNSNVVAYLLKQGVDIEKRDASGKTALMWAVNGADKDLSIVQALLSSGAKTNVADNNGSTVLDLARASPQKERLMEELSRGRQPKQ